MGFLKANNLATLVLDGEQATRTNLDRMCSPKASELVAPMLGRGRANKKILHIIFLKADKSVLKVKRVPYRTDRVRLLLDEWLMVARIGC